MSRGHKRKVETVKYRVAATSVLAQFPIDMLRYDHAYPASETDSHKIVGTISYAAPATEPVELVCHANGSPNNERWQSFGWHVTHVYNGYEWEPYYGHRVNK